MKTIKILTVFPALIVCSLLFVSCSFFGLSYSAREKKHYMDKSNFVTVTAVYVSSGYYSYPSEKYCYAIDFENAEYERTGFWV